MKSLTPYLFFDGNCKEAMEFYASALQGELRLMRAGEAPGAPSAHPDRVMHAHLSAGPVTLMASDWMASEPFPAGANAFSLSLEFEGRDEQERVFAALQTGGHVTMPLQDTFWNAHFGMLIDRFGNRWMLSAPPASA